MDQINRTVAFVYFDIGGVLLHYRGALAALAEETGVPHAELERIYVQHANEVDTNQISMQDLWNKFVEELGIAQRTNFDYTQFVADHYEKIGIAHKFLEEVNKYYPVGLVSNIGKGVLDATIASGSIPRIAYAAVVESYALGVLKPHREIYEVATIRAGVKPNEIFFMDDNDLNVKAARDFGWQAMHFKEDAPEKSVSEARKILGL